MEKIRAESSATVTSPPTLVKIGNASQLKGSGPHAISADGRDLVLVRTSHGARVFQGRCPHQGALLGEGELDGDTLVCRNHRWRFNTETGRRDGGPQCLVACPVVETDGNLWVDVSALASESAAAPAPARDAAKRTVNDLPHPPGLPFLGNLLSLDLDRLHLVLEGWAAKYGSLFALRLVGKRVLVVSDPELSQIVFRARPETYRRSSKLERVFDELGVAGVFSAEGSAWRAQRRLAMEALSHRNLRGFYPSLQKVAERLRRRWQTAAQAGTALDIVEELKRFTVDVTTLLTFGEDVNTLEQTGDAVIQRRLELLFPTFQRRIFATIPMWRFIRSPRDRQVDQAIAELRAWLERLVAEARARVAAEPNRVASPANFLEAMIAARDESGQPFSDAVIFGNLLTMLLAGEDTTAYTLAWAIHHLCDDPQSVAALRAELGTGAVPSDIEAANRLVYAGAIANEAMRLRPVAPLLIFETLTPTILGDIDLPAESVVMVLTRPPAVDARRFHAPDQFLPQRWLDPNPTGPHEPAAHIPFGSGPRICPGRSLALLEMKVLLATLYGSFDVTRTAPAADVREQFAFTMSPAGLSVALHPRGADTRARDT